MRQNRQLRRQKSDRVAVSLSIRTFHQSDGTSAACPVEYDYRLSKHLLSSLSQSPRGCICSPAGSIRYDQCDRFIGKIGTDAIVAPVSGYAGSDKEKCSYHNCCYS
ncbi:hypothetical protein D3C76_1526170 [compost metagenome]